MWVFADISKGFLPKRRLREKLKSLAFVKGL